VTLAAFVIQLAEAVKAVARIARQLARSADLADVLGEFEHAGRRANDVLFLGRH
jgi:hypothetical protein